jgi:hypothetical protein
MKRNGVAAPNDRFNPGAGELLQQLFEVDPEIHLDPPATASRTRAFGR